jgi:ribonuclease G
MTKELIVSSNSHESTVALLEDDQLVEIIIARGAQHGLAGSIYKGRVTRVLPGMQSAFVNIGLDRDAFLYVSDFVGEMEDLEEAATDSGAVQAVERSTGKALEVAPKPDEGEEAAEDAAAPENGRAKIQLEPREESDGDEAGEEVDGNRVSDREADREAAGARDRGRERTGERSEQRAGERGEQHPRERGEQQAGRGDQQATGEPGSAADREGGRDGNRDGDQDRDGRRGRGRRSRRRRGRGGRFPDAKYARVEDGQQQPAKDTAGSRTPDPEARPQSREREEPEEDAGFTVLPGESLAKYSGASARSEERGESGREDFAPGDDSDNESDNASGDDSGKDSRGGRQPRADFDGDGDARGQRRGRSQEQEDDEPRQRFGRGSRPEFERSMADDDEDSAPEPETERRPGSSGETVAVARDSGDDGRDGGSAQDREDEEDPSAKDEQQAAAAEDDEDNNGEANGNVLDLDDSEAEQVREALGLDENGASALEDDSDDDASEEEASDDAEFSSDDDEGDDAQETAAAGSETAEGEDGAREARVRGRRGSSRYVHRRGGRRGRRRPRGRGAQQAEGGETAVAESTAEPLRTSITDLLSAGQEILVQISKEPLGKKGARITSHIAMPGRYLVYMPTVEHVGVSRKIASDNERLRLRKIVQSHRTGMPGGFIVRTAGAGATEEEIRGDMLFLYNLWLDIRQKAEQRPAPSLIHQDLDIVERVLRDQLGSDFKTMWVDSESEYERILRFVERFQPKLLSRVKLYTRSKPIFDAFNITPELEKALRPKVWLKSGGYIVINQTEALVAIDVNTGKFVGKSDRLEDTIVRTNVEAVQEIVRQIRLRDLGGIIVVDFIDMDDRKNRHQVMQALDQELRLDRAPSKSLHFNEFGLVAITRKRVKQSLERTLCTPCPYCTGSGFVKSIDTVVFEILSEAKKMAPRVRARKDLTIRVNPEIARTLKSRDNSYLQEIEEIFRANVLVRGDVSLHREHFDIN